MKPTQSGAFEQLFDGVTARAYGLALSLTRNHTDAENLVQEAALRAFRSFATFQADSNFRAWFIRIITNCYLEDVRKRKTWSGVGEVLQIADPFVEDPPDLTSEPARLLLHKLDGEAVRSAIASLPSEFRLVLALYFVEELGYAEIAEVLQCPLGTVRSRIHRGRKLLKAALQQRK